MKDNNIYFTKLGTVKCHEFELTYQDFFTKMTRFISDNIDKYQVIYDKEKDYYEIIYNYDKYRVKYGKEDLKNNCDNSDLLLQIKNLVDLSKTEAIRQKKEKDRENEILKKQQEAMNNARLGIINTNEEKKARIAQIKKEDNKYKTEIFRDTMRIIGLMNHREPVLKGTRDWICVLSVVAGYIFAISIVEPIPTWVFIFWGFTLTSLIDTVTINVELMEDYGGLFATILSILGSPFILAFHAGKRLVEKIRTFIEIFPIKRSITKDKPTKELKTKINIEDMSNVISILEEKNKQENNSSSNVLVITNRVNVLKKNIFKLMDNGIRNDYLRELRDIIEQYEKTNKYDSDGARINLVNLTANLELRVNEALKQQKEQESIERGYQRLMSEINNQENNLSEDSGYQKSIGARTGY